MIYNENKIYAKVWKVSPSENGKYIDLQITTSEKDTDGNYINSSWFPRCIGKSVNTLKGVKREDKIIILKSKFTNERKSLEDGSFKSFFRFLILEAEIENANTKDGIDNTKETKKEQNDFDAAAEQGTEENDPW